MTRDLRTPMQKLVDSIALAVHPIDEREGKCGIVARANETKRARVRIVARENIRRHLFSVEDGMVIRLK